MFRDDTPDPEPAHIPSSFEDQAMLVIAESPQPLDFYNTEDRPDVLGFEKPSEHAHLWTAPQFDAIYLPDDLLAYPVPLVDGQPHLWAMRDRNQGGVMLAPSSPDGKPHPLVLPHPAACIQFVELLTGQIVDLWPEGVTANEKRFYSPHAMTFRGRQRLYPRVPARRSP